MTIILAILIGALIGWLGARLVGRHEGFLGSAVIGILGAIIGTTIARILGASAYINFSWSGLLWALIGAVILSALLNRLQSGRHSTRQDY